MGTRSTVRLGFASTLPTGYEIEGKAVFSAINSVLYIELQSIVSTTLD